MSRRLRYINDVEEIQKWIAAMTSVLNLMLSAATISEVYTDGWRPWTRKGQDLPYSNGIVANSGNPIRIGVKKANRKTQPTKFSISYAG